MSGSSSQNQGTNQYTNNSSNQRSGGSTFGQNIANQPWLEHMYNNAGNLYNQQIGQMNGMVPGAMNFQNQQAQNAAKTNQGIQQGGVYGGLGIGNQLMDSLKQSQNTPSATQSIYGQMMGGNGNNYADAMKQQYVNDANRTQQNMMSNLDARAAGTGMTGSSRQGVAQGIAERGINDSLQKNLAETGYNTFDKDLSNKLNIAQQADTNNFNRQNLMSGMLGQQQGTINQGFNNTGALQGYGMGQFNAANQPWQQMQGYQSAIGGPNVLNSGTSYNQGSGTSIGSGMGQNSGSSKGGGVL
jgi:hypothetical protein